MSDLKAVLWDLDGTLIDSESYWIRAEVELAAQYGAAWGSEDGLASVGQPLVHTARAMVAKGVPLEPEEIQKTLLGRMRDHVVSGGLPFRPGAEKLVRSLQGAGIVQALVTMSYGPYVDGVLEAADFFETVRTGDTVSRGKPDPEIYLAAIDDLGLRPAQCLGIEDSPAGAGALVAAGVTPLAVPHMVEIPPREELLQLPTLEGLDASRLMQIHREWQAGVLEEAR